MKLVLTYCTWISTHQEYWWKGNVTCDILENTILYIHNDTRMHLQVFEVHNIDRTGDGTARHTHTLSLSLSLLHSIEPVFLLSQIWWDFLFLICGGEVNLDLLWQHRYNQPSCPVRIKKSILSYFTSLHTYWHRSSIIKHLYLFDASYYHRLIQQGKWTNRYKEERERERERERMWRKQKEAHHQALIIIMIILTKTTRSTLVQ